MTTCAAPRTLLDDLDAAVRALADPAGGPTVDGRRLGPDLPQRPIPVVELRALLLRETTSFDTRDRALAWIAMQARQQEEPWSLIWVWTLLPGLRRMRTRLLHAGADREEVEAELVAGVLGALHDRALGAGIAARVCWTAYRGARRGLGLDEPRPLDIDDLLAPPSAPRGTSTGAAEDVLRGAVRAGVLTEADAELVAASRLDGRDLRELAAASGVRAETLQRRRARAEARIAGLLDLSTRGVRPERGRLGARWRWALAHVEANRRAAGTYRPWGESRRGARCVHRQVTPPAVDTRGGAVENAAA